MVLEFLLGSIFSAGKAQAAHLLITEDTGIQETGNTQIELNGEYGWDRETAEGIEVKEKAVGFETVLSFGVSDSLDAVLTGRIGIIFLLPLNILFGKQSAPSATSAKSAMPTGAQSVIRPSLSPV